MCIIHEAANEGTARSRYGSSLAAGGRPRPRRPPRGSDAAGRAAAAAAGGEGGVGGAAMADAEGLVSVDYEVYGKVQGVFFRKYTQVRAAVPEGGLPCLPVCAAPAVSPLRVPWRGRARGASRVVATATG